MNAAITHENRAISSGHAEYATFRLGEMLLGIEIHQIEEINRQLEVTPVPQAPRFVRGVVNLRGEVVTVLDLRTILGLPPVAITAASRNVIVRYGNEQVGLLVDRVADVAKVFADHVEPPPPNLNGVDGACFEGVCKLESELLVMLKTEAVLSDRMQNVEDSGS